MTVGNFPIHPEGFFEGHMAPWLHPFPLIMGLFTDIETHSGERMIVFTLKTDLDNSLR